MPTLDNEEITCGCPGCLTTSAVAEIVRQAIAERDAQQAAEEAAQWERAFGPDAPKNASAKRDRVMTIASSRALLANIRKPSS